MGKDPIEVDERIIKKMQKQVGDAAQAKTFIINNKHNQTTAFYYLLKIKAERDPEFLQEEKSQDEKAKDKRESSPLVYKP